MRHVKLIHYCYKIEKTTNNTYYLYVCHGNTLTVYEADKSLIDESVVTIGDMPTSKAVRIDVDNLANGAYQVGTRKNLYGIDMGNIILHWIACLKINHLSDVKGKLVAVFSTMCGDDPLVTINSIKAGTVKHKSLEKSNLTLSFGYKEYDNVA